MIKHYLAAGSLAVLCSAVMAEESMLTPGDMPQEAINEMTNNITAYNKCMMESRLNANKSGQDATQNADDILQSCEPQLDELKQLLTDNNVNPGLTEGMARTLRSKAARQLMGQAMNNMAAQAAAMENMEKSQQQ
ncbi:MULTISPECIES: hypothetical protein [Methylophaga]|uniref:Uncharacterized protein n=1 Tax=Methylophaga muralis TaxID=291169 RepID=A0A1E3GU72_9GAMM|nr:MULTISPECIES: hypothetical protein [Methylophaga]ODN67495.1 hypothetical protein A9E74_00840 [Methylophaga muralis]THK41267.1 hypothetical protein E8Q33_09190 [Methylophaga sp. SB9B]